MVQHVTPIRRAPRRGRPDGTSEPATFAVRWVDEDAGVKTATITAPDEQAVRDQLEPLVGSNSMTIRRVS